MPKSAKYFAIARQWQILQMVPVRPPGVTAREVMEYLEQSGIVVSKRTVERDLNELSLVFDLTCQDNGKAQGWYFATHRVPTVGAIDNLDAVMLVMAGDVLDRMLPKEAFVIIESRIEKAREKLKTLDGVAVSKWVDKVRYVHPTLPQMRPSIKHEVMRGIQQSLVQERQCTVVYKAADGKKKSYRLNPLALVLRGNIAYLIATAYTYSDVRLYALHRIQSVELEATVILRPPEFSLDEYLASGALGFEVGDEVKLRAVVQELLAKLLEESPLTEDQVLQKRDDCFELTATVRESWQLTAWILSQGLNIEILEPQTLRNQIAAILQESAARYNVTGKA